LAPLFGIFKILSFFLGHNFDVNKLKESSGTEFEKGSWFKLRMALNVLIMSSFVAMLCAYIISENVR
jgi:hypothetical protein